MHTVIESKILSSFFKSQPERIPVGTEYENMRWLSFWQFLKSQTDLLIHISDKMDVVDSVLITQLTTGRGETKISIEDTQFKCYKQDLKTSNPQSIFILDEVNESIRKKYRQRNGYLICFNDDYLNIWERLSLLNIQKEYPISKNPALKAKSFSSWEILNKYLLPFTDVIIVDSYIFSDNSLIPSNIEKILYQIDRSTPVKYNLSIVTYDGGKNKINGQIVFKKLLEIKDRLKLKCSIELILMNSIKKEHDRGIFFNYLAIHSGDSFNYFSSKGEVITKGRRISFGTMSDPNERNIAKIILHEIGEKVQNLKRLDSNNIFGECQNRLLV